MTGAVTPTSSQHHAWSASRVDALTDGTIAIVLTILALELKVPHPDGPDAGAALPTRLLHMWPVMLAYVLAFFSVGTLWVGHRSHFHFVHRTTRYQVWINLLFLMWVSLVPFVTGLMSEYPGRPLPVLLYGIVLTLAGASLQWNWLHACRRPELFTTPPTDAQKRGFVRRIAIGQAGYALGIALAYLNPWVSVVLYLLVPLYYLLPSGVDRHWLVHKTSVAGDSPTHPG
jgi:uncharacterized membrane protein